MELLRFARMQKENGKTDLALYVLNNITKATKIIETTWEMEGADEVLMRQNRDRLDILAKQRDFPCVDSCGGQWLVCARATLRKNSILIIDFTTAVKNLLEKGRGKYRNLLIVGPANCGKTFMLKPLKEIFNTFQNPATGSFAWIGVEESDIILLNDFRWSEKVISWQDF